MRRLVLFDIDGTLVSSHGGIGRVAISRVMTDLHGAAVDVTVEDCAGKPDPQIVRNVLIRLGYGPDDVSRLLPETVSRYLDRLEATYSEAAGAYCHEGVPELVGLLAARKDVTLGLLTGNIERGARIKLGPFGLNPHFPFGAYGSDRENRMELGPIAVERARAHTGIDFRGKDIVVIGDTQHDVRCAGPVGGTAIAVATGPVSREALAAENPDFLCDSLVPTEALLGAILGG